MSKRNRHTKNKIISKLNDLLNNINFKTINLTFSKKITILWSIIWYISLFLPWIIDSNESKSWNSFNSLSWNIWFLLIIILALPIFVIFSTNYKEKIKLYSDLSVKNHFIIITSGFFVLSFSIIILSFANWLQTFFEKTTYWNWVILSMTWWLIILIGWFMIRTEYHNNSSEIILNKLNQDREEAKEKDNMKLPF